MEENKKKSSKKWWIIGYSMLVVIIGLTAFLLHYNFKKSVYHFFVYSNDVLEAYDIYFQFSRDLGWFIWATVSFLGLAIGIGLTIWGRNIQDKQWETERDIHNLQLDSHLHERYENSCSMLGSDLIAVRIAGCQALRDLGMEHKKMKARCIRLLLAFINNPYLEDKNKDRKLDEVFPVDKLLRADIQEAFNSFSAIHRHYGDPEIDKIILALPKYFMQNEKKDTVWLPKGKFNTEDLKGI